MPLTLDALGKETEPERAAGKGGADLGRSPETALKLAQ